MGAGGIVIICGIKPTHDGAIALIDQGELVFCIECEKIDNNPRHTHFVLTLAQIEALLQQQGYSLGRIDRIVIDGWGEEQQPLAEEGAEFVISASLDGRAPQKLSLARYGHWIQDEPLLQSHEGSLQGLSQGYRSYMHVSGHLFGAYCTSPFASAREPSLVLVWDGGMPPQLFHLDPQTSAVRSVGVLFPILGSIYTLYPHAFRPFSDGPLTPSIAGKAMAYVALGNAEAKVCRALRGFLSDIEREVATSRQTAVLAHLVTRDFIRRAREFARVHEVPHTDMLASFHAVMEEYLLEGVTRYVRALPGTAPNLCFAGGCALNIKWNSALRASGLFRQVWVPPFPNDSGSALGTACCEMVRGEGRYALRWNVYSGPALPRQPLTSAAGWITRACTPEQLARLLHEEGKPVVFLQGRAELGPRALGHRSILAPAQGGAMKALLNDVKEREHYRPVAPLCLEEAAADIFDPGSADPYMLFEHRLRSSWEARLPAIRHLDGTARLQTINRQQDPLVHELLSHYFRLSGVPVLCNTSANLRGRGFFPDVESALKWGRRDHVWSEGRLYSKAKATA